MMAMDLEFASPARAPTDRVYVSWSEHLDLTDYVDVYLASRKYAVSTHSRSAILECMVSYPGNVPYRKSDMDFYLDANVRRKVGALPPSTR
jgi:hypothetical protein